MQDQVLVLFTNIIFVIRKMFRRGRIGLPVYYALEQCLDGELEQIDKDLSILKYEINRFREVV